jgi:hypothetical protein
MRGMAATIPNRTRRKIEAVEAEHVAAEILFTNSVLFTDTEIISKSCPDRAMRFRKDVLNRR